MNDFYAAGWLDRQLENAQRDVEVIESDLKGKRFMLHTVEGHLEQAVAKVNAIRLIRSRSGLEGSAKPADKTREE